MRTAPEDQRTDTQLVEAAQMGDLQAFGALVGRHQAGALRIATIALGTTAEAEDVAQDAFVKAQRSIAQFDLARRFEPWLYRIVTNTAKNRHRRNRRQAALTLRASGMADIAAPTPDDHAAHSADRSELVEALNQLDPSDRLILAYRWYDQLTEAEIAEALGCRPGTVKSRLHRAMARLRTQLDTNRTHS